MDMPTCGGIRSSENCDPFPHSCSFRRYSFNISIWHAAPILLQVQRGKYVIEAEISRLRGPSTCSPGCRRPRKRSCASMTASSSCARPNPARPQLGLLLRSLSISVLRRCYPVSCAPRQPCTERRRPRAFSCGPFAALLARMAALSCFPVTIAPVDYPCGSSQSNMLGAASCAELR